MSRIPLTMPKMSMTMEVGTIVAWEVAEGAQVKSGDVLVTVTTDKVDMDVEAVVDGVLVEIVAGPEDVVAVGQPIGYIESEAEDLLGHLFNAPAVPAEPTDQPASSPAQETSAEPMPEATTIHAVPLARRLAAEAGLDLREIKATGPGRTIRARDVRQALELAQANPRPAPRQAPAGGLLGDARSRRIRAITAKTLAASALIPQFTAYRTMNLSALAAARKAGLKGVSWTTLLTRAYAMMLRHYPALNGTWTEDGVRANEHVIISIAVDTPDGLLVPVIANPDQLTTRALDEAIRAIAATVKAGDASAADFSQGTGTVSNLGGMGVDRFNALLTPPQATALSLGSVRTMPLFTDTGEVAPRIVCDVGLTVDHRAADGADAARALHTMQDYLEDVVLLLS